MAYTTINKSSDYFNTKLFVGNSSTNAITGVGHKPDWTWIKRRDGGNGYSNFVFDAVRGVNKGISTNLTAAEITFNNGFNSFNSDGFTLGANTSNPSATELNASGGNYASWNWKAGTSFSNSANANGASIASTGSVNTTAGFSIVSYTGNGSTATVGHGLGVAPKVIMVKNKDAAVNWLVYHDSIAATNTLILNTTAASASDAAWNNTDPTSSVFSIGNTGSGNGSGQDLIAYCFAEKTGYSKFGSYTGNENSNGIFVFLGFKPALVIIKRSDQAQPWLLFDNKRSTFNVNQSKLFPNTTGAENTDTSNGVDFLSNGFKLKRNNGESNEAGAYIYMAFAAAPLVGTNNVPATAR